MDTQRTRNLIIAVCLGAVVAAAVAVGLFGVPLRSLLTYGLIALCPLVHAFMGHGAHGHSEGGTPHTVEVPVAATPDVHAAREVDRGALPSLSARR